MKLDARFRKPAGYRPILQDGSDAKTVKGEKFGFITGIMYFAPANESGVIDVCPMAGPCKLTCLFTAGRGRMSNVRRARIRKTIFYVEQRELFLACLRYDIERLRRKARRRGMRCVIRINGTSDLPQLALMMAREFPDVVFYDYTKISRPWKRILPNYHLTFSFGGDNLPATLEALAHGINAAVVFNTKKGKALPETWNGFRVIDGDISDLRFADESNVVIGLRAKGEAKHDSSGFVQSSGLIQIKTAAA